MNVRDKHLRRYDTSSNEETEAPSTEHEIFKISDDERYILNLIKASAERTIKMLWIIILVLIASLLASNACWVYYENDIKPLIIKSAIEHEFVLNPDTVEIIHKK